MACIASTLLGTSWELPKTKHALAKHHIPAWGTSWGLAKTSHIIAKHRLRSWELPANFACTRHVCVHVSRMRVCDANLHNKSTVPAACFATIRQFPIISCDDANTRRKHTRRRVGAQVLRTRIKLFVHIEGIALNSFHGIKGVANIVPYGHNLILHRDR